MTQDQALLTYLAGEPQDGVMPRVGDAIELRPTGMGKAIEAFSESGQRLGRLPPDEREALARLLPIGGAFLRGRIAAVVPRGGDRGSRLHILLPAA
jgi:hypothetical protein